jgi:hypothetical protein
MIWHNVQAYWVIPGGMIALYFYGIFHFNSPTYILDLGSSLNYSEIPGYGARLLTPAPPIYTASRKRFNKYARRYVLILETAFVMIIFFSSLTSEVVRILNEARGEVKTEFNIANLLLPSEVQTLQHRAILALFMLTGLLSSFPGFKDIDNWLLGALHKAAYIPDEVRELARTLRNAPFSVPPSSIVSLREKLDMPNSRSFKDESQLGRLERWVLAIFGLRNQLQAHMDAGRHMGFKIKLERDLQAISRQNEGLKAEIRAYIRDQDTLLEAIPASSYTNIDEYISDNTDNRYIAELYERRNLIEVKCDVLYQTMCLLTALSVFATEENSNDVWRSISKIGFSIPRQKLPPLDWDCVARAIFATFVLMIIINACYVLLSHAFGFVQVLHEVDPNAIKVQIIKFATLFTIVYSAIMIFVIRIKRKWLLDEQKGTHRQDLPQNIFVALICYAASVILYNTPFSYYMRGEMTWAPLLFALNQGLFAYFIGLYLDNSAQGRKLSLILPLWQGALAMLLTLIASIPYPPPGTEDSPYVVQIFIAMQSGLSGFLIGYMFQYFFLQKAASGDPLARGGTNEASSGARIQGTI